MNRRPRKGRVSECVLEFDPGMVLRLAGETDRQFRAPEPEHSQRLQRAVRYAWEHELTPTQQKYLLCYYQGGMRMREIAARYGVHPATVSRTVTRARNRLLHVLQYAL